MQQLLQRRSSRLQPLQCGSSAAPPRVRRRVRRVRLLHVVISVWRVRLLRLMELLELTPDVELLRLLRLLWLLQLVWSLRGRRAGEGVASRGRRAAAVAVQTGRQQRFAGRWPPPLRRPPAGLVAYTRAVLALSLTRSLLYGESL